MVTAKTIKNLRDKTGVSIMLCKKALEEAGGDIDKAVLVLRKQGLKIAEKKAERTMQAGTVNCYIHSNKQVGVLIEARSETDFVAKNDGFQSFVYDIAMHIAAMDPENIEELMEQPYIKNQDIKVGDYLNDTIQKFGENIKIARFMRYSVSQK